MRGCTKLGKWGREAENAGGEGKGGREGQAGAWGIRESLPQSPPLSLGRAGRCSAVGQGACGGTNVLRGGEGGAGVRAVVMPGWGERGEAPFSACHTPTQ